MPPQRQVLSWAVKPIFQPSIDVIARLKGYTDSRFRLDLFMTEKNIAGEVHLLSARGTWSVAPAPVERTDREAQDIAQGVADDIARVRKCEAEVFSGPLWFSFSDGLFEFSKTVLCDDQTVGIATQLVREHYALPFLQSLGNVIDFG